MEDIYFRHIMERCFSSAIHLSGDDAKKNDGNEICDYYIRYGNNVILIEFKDVLLSAALKDQSDNDPIYKELDKKFYENQKKDPKAIQQLSNAASYLEDNNPEFDILPTENNIDVYR